MVSRALASITIVSLVAGLAAADKQRPAAARPDPLALFAAVLSGDQPGGTRAPRFTFNTAGASDAPELAEEAAARAACTFPIARTAVPAVAADGKSAWLAVDLGWADPEMSDCTAALKPEGYQHATVLFEAGAPWQPVVWHLADPVSSRDQIKAMANKLVPDSIDQRVTGAEAVVALFEKSIDDPAALAATVSPRKDVVLYGSDRNERVVGGKQVAATLKRWSLSMGVRDGVQAGLTASGTVAWVAANVDAVSTRKADARPTPYRVLFLYEKGKGKAGWQLVSAHFSFWAR